MTPVRLIDLEPEWVRDGDAPGTRQRDASLTIDTSQGVMFLCPKCFEKNGGPVGTHSVLTWFRGRGVEPERRPGPGRWTVTGTGFEDLTLQPSVDLTAGGRHPDEWHGWISNGVAT